MTQQDISIEAILSQLENLAQSLETGQLPFNEALAQYKQGLTMIEQCKQYLRTAKNELKELHDQYINDEEV